MMMEEDSGYAPCRIHHGRIRELEAELAEVRNLLWRRNERTAPLKARAEKAEASRDISIRIASELTIERDGLKARVAELERVIKGVTDGDIVLTREREEC